MFELLLPIVRLIMGTTFIYICLSLSLVENAYDMRTVSELSRIRRYSLFFFFLFDLSIRNEIRLLCCVIPSDSLSKIDRPFSVFIY